MNGCIWLWVAAEVCVMQYSDTPLGAACRVGQLDVVKLLIEKCDGLDVNKADTVMSGFVIAVVCIVWGRTVLCSSSWRWQ